MPQYEWAKMTPEQYFTALVEYFEGDAMFWSIEGVVEVEEFEENGAKLARIIGEPTKYEVNDIGYVHQRKGHGEDDYYGFVLVPLNGSKFLKVSYQC